MLMAVRWILGAILVSWVSASESLLVVGSDTMGDLLSVTAQAFEKDTGIKVHVRPTSSHIGLKALAQGRCDFAAFSRQLTIAEKNLYPSFGAALVAKDLLVFVVHQDNPIEQLSRKQIQDIYLGKTQRWSDILGKEGLSSTKVEDEIYPISKQAGHASLDVFMSYFGFERFKKNLGAIAFQQLNTKEFGGMVVAIDDDQQALARLIYKKSGLAYVSLQNFSKNRTHAHIKMIAQEGIYPDAEDDYPLIRSCYLLFKKDELSDVGEVYLKWMQGPKGQHIVKQLNLIRVDG